jgi:hypothetical protein
LLFFDGDFSKVCHLGCHKSCLRRRLVIAIWAGVSSTTPSLLPPALNACYAGYLCVLPILAINNDEWTHLLGARCFIAVVHCLWASALCR